MYEDNMAILDELKGILWIFQKSLTKHEVLCGSGVKLSSTNNAQKLSKKATNQLETCAF